MQLHSRSNRKRLFLCLSWAVIFVQGAIVKGEILKNTDTKTNETDLALVLEANGEHQSAIDAFELRISNLEKNLGPFTKELSEPLMGLARNNFAIKNFDEVITSLRRAQHILHRYQGVYAEEQIESIDLLIETYLAQNEVDLAHKQQYFKYFISEHNHGADSITLLPALREVTNWYIDTGQFNRARKSLKKSKEIITSARGELDPLHLEITKDLAKVRRLSRFCCSHRLLENGLDIIKANPNLSSEQQADYYLGLADAYTIGRKPEQARKFYQKAWSLMGGRERLENFDEPQGIIFARELSEGVSPSTKILLVKQDRFGARQFDEISNKERLFLESLPPQEFTFIKDKDTPLMRLRDMNSGSSIEDKSERRVIGYPFRFNRGQLQQVLPFRYKQDDDLANLVIEMEFTINQYGDTEDIKILNTDFPIKLSRLMRNVLNRTRFRPRFVEGEPQVTKAYHLSQTFEP